MIRPSADKDERVSPPYRSYSLGNPSEVILKHGTQFFRGYHYPSANVVFLEVGKPGNPEKIPGSNPRPATNSTDI